MAMILEQISALQTTLNEMSRELVNDRAQELLSTKRFNPLQTYLTEIYSRGALATSTNLDYDISSIVKDLLEKEKMEEDKDNGS
ncbi:MAG: hypothetical protein V3S97_02050 [Candidatus Bathyarchaeia archaeon]